MTCKHGVAPRSSLRALITAYCHANQALLLTSKEGQRFTHARVICNEHLLRHILVQCCSHTRGMREKCEQVPLLWPLHTHLWYVSANTTVVCVSTHNCGMCQPEARQNALTGAVVQLMQHLRAQLCVCTCAGMESIIRCVLAGVCLCWRESALKPPLRNLL